MNSFCKAAATAALALLAGCGESAPDVPPIQGVYAFESGARYRAERVETENGVRLAVSPISPGLYEGGVDVFAREAGMKPGQSTLLVLTTLKESAWANDLCFVAAGRESDPVSPAFCMTPAGKGEPLGAEDAAAFGVTDAAPTGTARKEALLYFVAALNDAKASGREGSFFIAK